MTVFVNTKGFDPPVVCARYLRVGMGFIHLRVSSLCEEHHNSGCVKRHFSIAIDDMIHCMMCLGNSHPTRAHVERYNSGKLLVGVYTLLV